MSKYVEFALKGAIISSTMIATNEVADYYDKFSSINGSGHKLATKIAGSSIGFVVGRRVANEITKVIKAAIAAYNGEVEDNA